MKMGKLIEECGLLYRDLCDERTSDTYLATPAEATERLLELETFSPIVWEPACGAGHISEVLLEHGHDVLASDLYDRGYGISKVDLFQQVGEFPYDIITNPPEDLTAEFIEKILDLAAEGRKVAIFLKLAILHGVRRVRLFEMHPPKKVYVGKTRYCCAKNAEFGRFHPRKDGFPYMWVVWEKGYKGSTELGWF